MSELTYKSSLSSLYSVVSRVLFTGWTKRHTTPGVSILSDCTTDVVSTGYSRSRRQCFLLCVGIFDISVVKWFLTGPKVHGASVFTFYSS